MIILLRQIFQLPIDIVNFLNKKRFPVLQKNQYYLSFIERIHWKLNFFTQRKQYLMQIFQKKRIRLIKPLFIRINCLRASKY